MKVGNFKATLGKILIAKGGDTPPEWGDPDVTIKHPNFTVSPSTGSGAIAASVTPGARFRLIMVRCHFSAAPTTSENFEVTLNAGDGAAYDTVLFSQDPSVGSVKDIVWTPSDGHIYESDDVIDVAYTNTDGVTYGLAITYEEV